MARHNGIDKSEAETLAGKAPASGGAATVVSDANAANWVYRYAPGFLRGYLKLARLDRPVGVWLLLWPCWWSLSLATPAGKLPDPWTMVLFMIGALAMRGAGCTYNDIVDRDIDAKVARTALRPIPAGEVSAKAAAGFLVFQSLIGLAVLLQFNVFSIWLGIASLALVMLYPFMKRITWWPQAWLGLTFNWGALMGWSVVDGTLDAPAILLYAACIFWTLGYDTIYAHQDREDDALIGVKSSARRLGDSTRPALILFYALFYLGLVCAFAMQGYGTVFYMLAAAGGVHLIYQAIKLDIHDGTLCLKLFKSNILLGGLLFAGMFLDLTLRL